MRLQEIQKRFARVHRPDGRGYVPQETRYLPILAAKLAGVLGGVTLLLPVSDYLLKGEYALSRGLEAVPWAFAFAWSGAIAYAFWSTRHRHRDPYRFAVRQYRFFVVPVEAWDEAQLMLLRFGFESHGAEPIPEGTQELLTCPLANFVLDPSRDDSLAGSVAHVTVALRILKVEEGSRLYVTFEGLTHRANYSDSLYRALERLCALPQLAPYRTDERFGDPA